jgi:D-proline reductase (dithiol) PrdB
MSGNCAPIPYIQRTRSYYLALGYANPYQWAHHEDAPFAALRQPLPETRIALVTTAAPFRPDKGDQGPGAPYNALAKFYAVYSGDTARDHDVRIAHVAIDRKHTSMDDSGCWFPLLVMRRLADEGVFELGPRFHGFPTNRSQQRTREVDAPDLLARCRADGAQAVLLVANCPVCHQSLSLAARHLEVNGIATVILGCARDIVEYCSVARFLFSDFPLGNAAGRPRDPASQGQTLLLALALLQNAREPRTTWQSPLTWQDAPDWKEDYANAERVSPEELARLRAEVERARLTAKDIRLNTLTPSSANRA